MRNPSTSTADFAPCKRFFSTHLCCIIGAQLQLLQARHLQQLPQVIRRAHLWQGAQRQDLQLTHACQVPQAVPSKLFWVGPQG
jgi:hypothetical protein